MRLLVITLVAFLVAPAVFAQKHDHAQHRRADSVPIRDADSTSATTSLSPDDVNGLLGGSGMGLARAAELNHYPGPLHVLELAADLGLSAEQRAEAERLRHAVKAEARTLGAQIVERERHLDQLFAGGEATPEAVDRITAHIAEANGRLRAAHLRAHVAMRDVLTPDQIIEYDRLRGHAENR